MEPGSPSITAQKVALQRLTFERVPAPYGDPGADIALASDVAAGSVVDGESRLSTYLAARTVFFDRVVVGAIDRGVTQAVIVGAGYDGRALRYAKDGVSWFELDHPATQGDKRARLDRLGIDTTR
ncbi:MAG TPA: class I SAM-dependent methyltransferase, partial [Acidimicrobiales bacterium]|nr:class I SAM-dependent methyltransferase [Acidimicrobiales bacterium]